MAHCAHPQGMEGKQGSPGEPGGDGKTVSVQCMQFNYYCSSQLCLQHNSTCFSFTMVCQSVRVLLGQKAPLGLKDPLEFLDHLVFLVFPDSQDSKEMMYEFEQPADISNL